MRVEPIIAAAKIKSRKPHVFIIIRRNAHTVINQDTGDRTTLPPSEAWEYYAKVNIII